MRKFSKVRALRGIFALLLTSACPLACVAEVEAIGFWKFDGGGGQSEGAEISGDAITGEGGGPELLIRGNPMYSTDAPEGGITKGSIKFNMGDILYREEPITNQDDLFGIEIWVKSEDPMATAGAGLVKNGRGQPGFGYGLQQSGESTYMGIYDGVTYIQSQDTPIPVTGEWTHLALVRDAESFGTQLYANGELIYSSERRAPVPVVPDKGKGAFIVGGNLFANNAMKGSFAGHIALVRVFKFKPGEFKAEDLLYQSKQ